MPFKPMFKSQVAAQTGMARPGGMASRGSTKVDATKGSSFAAMQNALLKKGIRRPAQATAAGKGKPGRQFQTKAAGGDATLSKPKSDVQISASPTGLRRVQAWGRAGKQPHS